MSLSPQKQAQNQSNNNLSYSIKTQKNQIKEILKKRYLQKFKKNPNPELQNRILSIIEEKLNANQNENSNQIKEDLKSIEVQVEDLKKSQMVNSIQVHQQLSQQNQSTISPQHSPRSNQQMSPRQSQQFSPRQILKNQIILPKINQSANTSVIQTPLGGLKTNTNFQDQIEKRISTLQNNPTKIRHQSVQENPTSKQSIEYSDYDIAQSGQFNKIQSRQLESSPSQISMLYPQYQMPRKKTIQMSPPTLKAKVVKNNHIWTFDDSVQDPWGELIKFKDFLEQEEKNNLIKKYRGQEQDVQYVQRNQILDREKFKKIVKDKELFESGQFIIEQNTLHEKELAKKAQQKSSNRDKYRNTLNQQVDFKGQINEQYKQEENIKQQKDQKYNNRIYAKYDQLENNRQNMVKNTKRVLEDQISEKRKRRGISEQIEKDVFAMDCDKDSTIFQTYKNTLLNTYNPKRVITKQEFQNLKNNNNFINHLDKLNSERAQNNKNILHNNTKYIKDQIDFRTQREIEGKKMSTQDYVQNQELMKKYIRYQRQQGLLSAE